MRASTIGQHQGKQHEHAAYTSRRGKVVTVSTSGSFQSDFRFLIADLHSFAVTDQSARTAEWGVLPGDC
jgi:hypothetical protein